MPTDKKQSETYLALDVGDRKVGVAMADSIVRISLPHGMFIRPNGEAEREILKLIEERQISTLVVGMPLNEDGTKGPQCRRVEQFCRRLLRRCSASIYYVDEYGTSREAQEHLRGNRRRGDALASREDAVAAALILKEYLEREPQSDK